jgi:hypothetical protein
VPTFSGCRNSFGNTWLLRGVRLSEESAETRTFGGCTNLKLLTYKGLSRMGVEGLEPSTLRLRVTCSNQLSYTPASVLL